MKAVSKDTHQEHRWGIAEMQARFLSLQDSDKEDPILSYWK